MLKELSKDDAKWRQYALLICKDKYLADDLVNDMYLKLMDKEDVSYRYVYVTILNLFKDHLRLNKKITTIDVIDLENLTVKDTSNVQERMELLEILKDNFGMFHKEVLLITHEMSLRQAEAQTGVSYQKLNYHKTRALDKLIKKYRL